jgi:hypothetical protein
MESTSKGGPPGESGVARFPALRAVSELHHPHLVAMRRASAGPGFEPEARGGLTLAQLGEGPNGVGVLTLRIRLRVLLDALSGLAALHRVKLDGEPIGFVHGEVAPHNITVGRDGIGRLVPLVESHWSSPPVPAPESLGYVAPERLLGDVFDQRADVFSIGVLLWEAIAEKRLFRNLGMDAIVTQLVGGKVSRPPPPPGTPWADALTDVAMQALAVDPADRWPHVGVMGAEIETIAEGCLASSEEIALLVRRGAGGDRQPIGMGAPPSGVPTPVSVAPYAISTSRPDAALMSTPDPVASPPRTGALPPTGVVVWHSPHSARTPSGIGRERDGFRRSSPDAAPPSRHRPSREVVARQSKIVWTAVGLGTALFFLTAYELFDRDGTSSTATAGPTGLLPLAPSSPVAADPIGPAAVPHDTVTPPGRPQVASDASRPKARATTPTAAPRGPSSPRAIEKPSAAPAAPPAAVPAPPASAPESPTTAPSVAKPKEDPFGI